MQKHIKPLWPELWPHLWRRLAEHASKSLLLHETRDSENPLGRQGEEAAYWHLRAKGFVMVARNYRPEESHGEIDLIGWDNATLVFVEVKARRSSHLLTPDAAVDRTKQRHIAIAAREYRNRRNLNQQPFRFDIVSIVVSILAAEPAAGDTFPAMQIEHIPNAFSEASL